MLRKRAPFLALAALSLALSACGSGSSGGSSGGTNAGNSGSSPSAGGGSSSSASPAAAGGGGGGKGTMAIITVDPSNPYWKAEIETASAEAKKLGYQTTINAHDNDQTKQNQFIDSAIAAKVKAIILDPAGAKESIGAVQKATNAGIPVFLVNAEIDQQGIAKSQIVSNNAQGATLGAQEWVKVMGNKGTYVELFGNPTDNNAKVRSDAYHGVIDQYPGLKLVQKETANWDRQQGKQKMEVMLQAHPNINGVISGNDEMALGAIQALKDAGKLSKIKVLGFDGNQDAANAVKAGEMVATVLQPIVQGSKMAVDQADSYLRTGKTGASSEKQAINCVLITKANADKLNNFVYSG